MDVCLLDEGREQARAIARELKRLNVHPALILTGTLMRTNETAEIVSRSLGGIPIEIDRVFDERRLGEWNGRSISDTEPLIAAKLTPPGGESEAEFSARVRRALERVVLLIDRPILVVSSKGVGRILHNLTGGEGRLAMGNGEVVRFSVPQLRPHARPQPALEPR